MEPLYKEFLKLDSQNGTTHSLFIIILDHFMQSE